MVKQYPSDKKLLVCQECGKICSKLRGLSRHIHNQHKAITKKIYYNRYLKSKDEDLCKICGKEAIFKDFIYGYKTGCCKEHMNEWNQKQIKKAVKEKYGIDNVYQLEETKDSIKKTCLKKYGVEYTHQNSAIFKKAFKTGLKILQYKNTNIWYQGSYELDFLEKYFDKYDIQNARPIKYFFENKQHVYHPDFYIPLLNLIIECKSTYYYEKNKLLDNAKKKATLDNNFNYLMILDKNYAGLF